MLRCTALTKTYRSGGRDLKVLNDITFSVEPGGFAAIVGPSGSGKTTLLGLLAGLADGGFWSMSCSTARSWARWTRMPEPGCEARRSDSSSSRSS